MATYTPSSSSFPNGVISVISNDGTTYETIQNSISGGTNYRMDELYLKCEDVAQVLQTIGFQKYNVNGDIQDKLVVPTVDPFSFQPSLFIDFDDPNYILDGRLSISYFIQAGATVYFYLDVTVLSPSDLLPPHNDDNLMEFLNIHNFFTEYQEQIPINFDYDEIGVPQCTDKEPKDM